MKLEIGQRIDIYKVVTDGHYDYNEMEPGTFRPAISNIRNNIVRLLSNSCIHKRGLGMFVGQEAVKVGTMIIKSIK